MVADLGSGRLNHKQDLGVEYAMDNHRLYTQKETTPQHAQIPLCVTSGGHLTRRDQAAVLWPLLIAFRCC